MSKKFLRIISMLVVSLMIFSVVGCSSEDKTASEEKVEKEAVTTETAKPAESTEATPEEPVVEVKHDPVTIKYTTFRAEDEEVFKQLIEKFQTENPYITVELEPVADLAAYYQTLQANILAGEIQDVFDVHPDPRWYYDFVDAGTIADLSDLDFVNNLQPASKNMLLYNDKIYGYNHGVNLICGFYNKAIYDKNGVTAPTNWNDFVAGVDKLKAAGEGGFGYIAGSVGSAWIRQAILMETMGADGYKKMMIGLDSGDITELSSNKDFVTAIQTLSAYNKAGVFHENAISTQYPQGLALFAQGETPSMMMGTWTFGTREADYPGIEVGIFPIQTTGNATKYYAEAGQISVVSASSPNLEEAKKWVNFLASAENAQIYIDKTKMSPTISGVIADFPGYELIEAAFKQGVEIAPIIKVSKAEFYGPLFDALYENVLFNGADPIAEIQNLDKGLAELDIKNKK